MASSYSLLFSKFTNKLFLFSLLATMLNYPSNNAQPTTQRLNQTNLVFFLQDFASAGPNATVVPVTGIPGKSWSFATFGTVYAVDDDKKSNEVGRAQGVPITSALDASNVNVLMSIVFTNAEYSGSTLELQGISRKSERYREISVVSGTGTFRFARGYAILETIYYARDISYSIIRCTIRLLES